MNFAGLTVFNRGSRRESKERCDICQYPYWQRKLGGNIHVGLAALGAAIGVGLIGMESFRSGGT